MSEKKALIISTGLFILSFILFLISLGDFFNDLVNFLLIFPAFGFCIAAWIITQKNIKTTESFLIKKIKKIFLKK